MFRIPTPLLLIALLALPAAARAQAGDGWQGMDLNDDGAISLDEMREQRASRFNVLDRDGDRLLDRNELAAARDQFATFGTGDGGGRRGEALQKRMFDRADGNGDGALSREEFVDAAAPVFARLDRDGDGLITAAERDAVAERLRGLRR